MDPSQQAQDASMQPQLYYTYDDHDQYNMAYAGPTHPPYQQQQHVMQHHQPQQQQQPQQTHMQQQALHYHGIPVPQQQAYHHQYTPYPGPASSPPHVAMPVPSSSASPPPPSPTNTYDPLSPQISGSDTSGDGTYYHSNSSGANSPSSSRGSSLVHRQRSNHRYNPTPSPTSSSGRRSQRDQSQDSDELDEDMGVNYRDNLASTRKEATRRQRIEAEQRRRDELRDGYAKLKDVLPVSNLKSSKVSLLERATNHIIALEKANQELQQRIDELDAEATRIRSMNEKISLGTGDTPSPGMLESEADLDVKEPPEGQGASLGMEHRQIAPPPGAELHTLSRASPTPSSESAF